MELDIMQYVKGAMVIAVVTIIQIIKSQLAGRGIAFKKDDTWVWVTLLCGLPMAILATGIDNKFVNFNIFDFIVTSFLYASATTMTYKIYKISKPSLQKPDDPAGKVDNGGI